MISKELLSEVMFNGRVEIRSIGINNNILEYSLFCSINEKDGTNFNEDMPDNYYVVKQNICEYINIYELAHKCKEWAYNKGFLYWYENSKLYIKIMHSCKVDFEIDIGNYKKPFEIDIDFKACQWILNNKDRK